MDLEALRALVARDSRSALSFELDAPAPVGPGTGRQLHATLREAKHQGLLTGDLSDHGSEVAWFTPRLTLQALRALGEWPPTGGEMIPGRWDTGVWGERSKGVLRELASSPPRGDYLFGPTPGSGDPGPWIQWDAVRRLLETGLIEGVLQASGIQDVRVTAAGHRALTVEPGDPLQAARVQIARDAKGDAVNAAIEETLKVRLIELAAATNVSVMHNGKPKHLSVLKDNLATEGAYSESWRAEIGAWLAIRNDVDHGGGAGVAAERIERLIAGVELFLQEHPVPEPPST